jgi:hypothetical protein
MGGKRRKVEKLKVKRRKKKRECDAIKTSVSAIEDIM